MTEQSKPATPQLGTCRRPKHNAPIGALHYQTDYCLDFKPLPVETAAQEKPEVCPRCGSDEKSEHHCIACYELRHDLPATRTGCGWCDHPWHDAVADAQKEIAPHSSKIFTDLTVRCHRCKGTVIWRYIEESDEIEVFHGPCVKAAAPTDRTDATKIGWSSGEEVVRRMDDVGYPERVSMERLRDPDLMAKRVAIAQSLIDQYVTEREMHNAWRKRAEEAEKELSEARHEASCCDDIKLDQPLAGIISSLQKERERLQAGSQFPIDRTDDGAEGASAPQPDEAEIKRGVREAYYGDDLELADKRGWTIDRDIYTLMRRAYEVAARASFPVEAPKQPDERDYKSLFDMYRKAWLREMGGRIWLKTHEIDGFVLRTREIYEKSQKWDAQEAAAEKRRLNVFHDVPEPSASAPQSVQPDRKEKA